VRRPRHVAVVVDTDARDRIDEALRAAVGLTLRGDRLTVAVVDRAATVLEQTGDGRPHRGLATLAQLGHDVRCPVPAAAAAHLVRTADAVEIWT